MSDLCNSCGNNCGCDNDSRCGCGNTWGLFGNNNDCCSWIWILIFLILFSGCGNNWSNNRMGNNSCLWIILILFFCNGNSTWSNDGCGCGCGC